MKKPTQILQLALPAIFAFLAVYPVSAAQNTAETGGIVDWFDPSAWSLGVYPLGANSSMLAITNGTTVNYDNSATFSTSSGANLETYWNSPDGTWTSYSAAPSNTVLDYYIYGGGIYYSVAGANPFSVGFGPNGAADGDNTLNLNGGVLGVSGVVSVGAKPTAGTTQTLNIGGGSNKALLLTGYIWLGVLPSSITTASSGNAVLNVLNNGKLRAYDLALGYGNQWNGNASVTVASGGVVEITHDITLAPNSATNLPAFSGNLFINGGTVTVDDAVRTGSNVSGVNFAGTNPNGRGAITLANGGSLTANRVFLGQDPGTYRLEINSGTLTTNRLYLGVANSTTRAGNVTLLVNGGTLNVNTTGTAISTSFLTGTANVTSDTVNAATPLGGVSDVAIILESGAINLRTLQTGLAKGGNHTVTVNGGNLTALTHIFLGSDNANASVTGIASNNLLTQNNGNVSVGSQLVIGSSNNRDNAFSKYALNNGNLTVTSYTIVAQHTSNAVFAMTGGNFTAKNMLQIGNGDSQAAFNMSGGNLTMTGSAAAGALVIGYQKSGASPTDFTLSGGTVRGVDWLWIGRSGATTAANFTQTAGSFTANTVELSPNSANARGNLTVTGGSFNTGNLAVGRAAAAGSEFRLKIGGSASVSISGTLAAGTADTTASSASYSFDPSKTALVAAGSGLSAIRFYGDSSTAIGHLALSLNNTAVVSTATLADAAQVTVGSLSVGAAASLTFESAASGLDALLTVTGSTSAAFDVAGKIIVDLSAFAAAFTGTLNLDLIAAASTHEAALQAIAAAAQTTGLAAPVDTLAFVVRDGAPGQKLLTLQLTNIPEPAATAALLAAACLALLLRHRERT